MYTYLPESVVTSVSHCSSLIGQSRLLLTNVETCSTTSSSLESVSGTSKSSDKLNVTSDCSRAPEKEYVYIP